MEDRSKDALVNREKPIPVVNLTSPNENAASGNERPNRQSRTGRFIKHATNMKDELLGRSPEKGPSLQDRLLDR